ncbi:MAG: hypothetical protein ACI4J1_06645 [Ruminiclostridium sp.]
MKTDSADSFFIENKDRLIEFGNMFVEKLTDKELIDKLAEKDLEKLARVFRLVFDRLDQAGKTDSSVLNQLVEAVREID